MAKTSGVVIGAVGCLSVLVMGGAAAFIALFFFGFVQRGGVYDGLRVQLNQRLLDDLLANVELYGTAHRHYPDSLATLAASAPNRSSIMIYDATVTGIPGQQREFFYRRVGCHHYYLRALGADGVPFTEDDVQPTTDPATVGNLGYLAERQPGAEAPCVAASDEAPTAAPPAD